MSGGPRRAEQPEAGQQSGGLNIPLTRELRSGCKINLHLRVGPRRADGYHDLETLFLPLDEPCDRLRVTIHDLGEAIKTDIPPASGCIPAHGVSPSSGMRVLCDLPGLDLLHNTLTRAWEAYARATGFAPGLTVELRKGVPAGAGLGGGSANAAALLLFLRELHGHSGGSPMSPEALGALAAGVGADVPFFLENIPARGAGIGERLTPVDSPVAGMFLVLLCPAINISTAWAFAALDRLREAGERPAKPESPLFGAEPAMRPPESAELKKDLNAAEKNMSGEDTKPLTSDGHRASTFFAHGALPENDFEPVVFAAHPKLAGLHARLLERGAAVARLSGTGSSVFGIFFSRERAEKARIALAGDVKRAYLVAL